MRKITRIISYYKIIINYLLMASYINFDFNNNNYI